VSGRLLIVGDAMLDRDVEGTVDRICPEAPVPVLDETVRSVRAGGAGLAATIAAAAGQDVGLITALGDDDAGRTVRRLLEGAGVDVLDLGSDGPTPEKVRLRCDGATMLRVDRGGGTRPRLGDLDGKHRDAIDDAGAALVSDYGRGISSHPELRRRLRRHARRAPLVWDPHPRGREPVAGARLATPNRDEATGLTESVRGRGLQADTARARELRRRWQVTAVAVTLGPDGALLETGAPEPTVVPALRAVHGDPCGAGDCFASIAAAALLNGAGMTEAVAAAVTAATAYVGGDRLGRNPTQQSSAGVESAIDLAARVRHEGGVVVATGGCFDLLHAGHVSTLEAARRLGDCLIVLMNSDASVARLKGERRPIVCQGDRARVLEGLACVDAVAVFDDDTPAPMLERLRPHVFAKGGDYAGVELAEAAVLRRFSGQTVILPTFGACSTSALIARAGRLVMEQ
jgi:D-beta-D-heptose 7-phosphate kinase / D-beta-D-heptose 1-phosphate adenosyltransferase